MLRKEIIHLDSKEKNTVSFFEDDNIETVREQISKSADTHPDRMFTLVNIKLPKDYYKEDIRRWESLFERLSYNGRYIEKTVFDEYQKNYRFPNTNVVFKDYDRSEWMLFPEHLSPLFSPTSKFSEYRIFGVAEKKSFILPVSGDSQFASRIPSASLPSPDNGSLISTFYKVEDIDHFAYEIYDQSKGQSSVLYYYPYLTSQTPNKLSEEAITLLNKNSKLLSDLIDIKIPKEDKHSSLHILKTRFHIPWVKTNFGAAIRTRFEQIFYGMTVSEDVPYIGFYTGTDDINRHKFYVENPKDKKPFLDMSVWKTWFSQHKPSRQIPTLILYRGKSRHDFDRIIITEDDMVVSTYRTHTSKDTIEDLKKTTRKWYENFDAVVPFVDESDIHLDRWELQDMTYILKYSNAITEFNTLRFNCISPFFSITNLDKSEFTILRANRLNNGITTVEAKLIQMSQEGPLEAKAVSQELSITEEHAKNLIRDVMSKQEEGQSLGDRLFRGFPMLIIESNAIHVRNVKETDLSSKYTDLLRYILSNPDSKELDTICPPRMQTIASHRAVIDTSTVDREAVMDESFADFFGDIDEVPTKKVEEEPETVVEEKTVFDVANQASTKYGYFLGMLKKFDPTTFVDKSEYPTNVCEYKNQPVPLTQKDKDRLSNFEKGKYDPIKNTEECKLLDTFNPDGTYICPEYWCTKDEIPLREDQLLIEDGIRRCPVCHGKIQTSSNVDLKEYPVIERKSGYVYPSYHSSQSPGSGKPWPCCYSTVHKKDRTHKQPEEKDKYYVFKETTRGLPEFRLAKVDKDTINLLGMNEKYDSLENQRMSESIGGFFRGGLGHPSETLPKYLGLEQKIPYPSESVQTVLKCSFMRLWSTVGTSNIPEIKAQLSGIKDEVIQEKIAGIVSGIDEAYRKKELSKIQELEYASLALQCDIFRINIKTHTIGCVLYASLVKPRSRAVIILQNGDEYDILTHAMRRKNLFVYKSNIFESPPFSKFLYRKVEGPRNQACTSEIPTYNQAFMALKKYFSDDEYFIILDPYERAQALYVPDKVVLPFQSVPVPDTTAPQLQGYSSANRLPSFTEMKQLLEKVKEITQGYTFQDALYNVAGYRTEILTVSGLRIPVQPEKVEPADFLDVLSTVSELGETSLTFGEQNEELKEKFKDISYQAEVYEFLLFQLSKDLETDDYGDIREALSSEKLERKKLESLLSKWFDKITDFVDIQEAGTFLTKIRTPCGQFTKSKCKGNLCGWDGKTCRVKIKKSVDKDQLFTRLVTTLYSNSKIRAVVLDGRTTPFFSTILYIELPHEMIVTDKDI